MRGTWPNVDVTNVFGLEVPVKLRLKLGAIVGLHHVHAKGEAPQDTVHKADGRVLIAGIKDLEHADTGAVINRGELIESSLAARNPLQKLHVHLQSVPRLGLFVALPPFPMRSMLLIRG